MSYRSSLLLFTALSLVLTPAPVRSEEKQPAEAPAAVTAEPLDTPEPEEQPSAPHSRILPVKIKPVQEGADGVSKAAPDIQPSDENAVDPDTLTLYSTQSSGSLGPNLWKDQTRAEILEGLKAFPVPHNSPQQRELALRVLLTKSAVPASADKEPVADVFDVRMTRLIELGAYKEAMALYEKLDNPAATPAAATAGMKAFVGNGQIAIACLEQKAVKPDLKSDDPFWADLAAFCKKYIKSDSDSGDVSQALMHASLAYIDEKKLKSPAKFEDLNQTTLVDLMALSQAGVLDRGKWTAASASTLDPSAISFLLNLNPTKADHKLSLLTAAVNDGVATRADLDKAYKEMSATAGGYGDWTPVLKNYNQLMSAPDPALVKSVLSTALPALTITALTPFAESFAALPSQDAFSETEALTILSVMVKAGVDFPAGWVNRAYGTEFTEESGESALLKVWYQDLLEAKKPLDKSNPQQKGNKAKVAPDAAYALILQRFIDNGEIPAALREQNYDNFLSLTGPTNYVMPSTVLMDNLNKASQVKLPGKVILLGLQALNGQDTAQVPPAVLNKVLKAFLTAGLSEETGSLAHEALQGLTVEKKEN